MIRFRPLVSAALVALMIGCGSDSRNAAPAPPAAQEGKSDTTTTAARADEPGNVLFLGTSLTAGYGLPSPDDAYPALVQEKIDSAGLPFRVINAGVSGETSAGALRRVDWLLRQPFDVLVLETGANDMLRGMDLDSTRANIAAIVERVRAARPGVRIVLVGMMAPPNLGEDYVRRFDALYPEMARSHDLVLVPFLLRDVGGVASLNQADGIHPNEKGEALLARNVWEVLGPVLEEEAGRRERVTR